MRELHTFVIAPVIGAEEPGWVATESGRLIGRYSTQARAWRAVSGAAYDASILGDEPTLVLMRDEHGSVTRHLELGVAPVAQLNGRRTAREK